MPSSTITINAATVPHTRKLDAAWCSAAGLGDDDGGSAATAAALVVDGADVDGGVAVAVAEAVWSGVCVGVGCGAADRRAWCVFDAGAFAAVVWVCAALLWGVGGAVVFGCADVGRGVGVGVGVGVAVCVGAGDDPHTAA